MKSKGLTAATLAPLVGAVLVLCVTDWYRAFLRSLAGGRPGELRRVPSLLVLLLMAAVLFLSLADWLRADPHAAAARPGVADLALDDGERVQLMQQAAAGDAAAAYRLAVYHARYKLDHATGKDWLTKAAALGHSEAQKWLADSADQ